MVPLHERKVQQSGALEEPNGGVCVVMLRITDSTRRHIIPSRTGITLLVEQCMLNMEQCMLNMEQCMLVAQANMLLVSEICS